MSHDHTNDDHTPAKKPAKRLVLQPIHADEVKAHAQQKNILKDPSEDSSMFDELAAKTAALAEQVKGSEVPKKRMLEIEESLTGHEPIDIFETTKITDNIQPIFEESATKTTESADPAVSLIRQKLSKIYQSEPDAKTEIEELSHTKVIHSKHQQFIRQLTTSQKSLADIQTDWHNYYISLPDNEKRDVWREFYEMQHAVNPRIGQQVSVTTKPHHNSPIPSKKPIIAAPTNLAEVKQRIHTTVSAGGRLTPIHHLKSLLFGISVSGFIGLIIAFVFFNEVFIAPFISPSRTVSATPIIGNIATTVDDSSKIIIPKINVEVPVVFDVGSIAEEDIQSSLENGVVHYATTPNPGEQGNSVIVGHSSNNILNSGKYKFAFVLLKRLEAEDLFYVQKNGVRYTYKVFEKKIVAPTDISVLGPSSKPNSMTLITCDPPGTSINRLIIVAEQISPDPSANKKPENTLVNETTTLPSNAPSLWSRLTDW